jgi:hypothetical protein
LRPNLSRVQGLTARLKARAQISGNSCLVRLPGLQPAYVKKLDQARSDSSSAQEWISNSERCFCYNGRCESAENRTRSRKLCFGFYLVYDILDLLPSRRPDRSRVHSHVAELICPNRDKNYYIASPDRSYRLVESIDKFRFI